MPRPQSQIDPIARFMQEHEVLLQHLAALGRVAKAVVQIPPRAETFRRISRVLAEIGNEVYVHNRKEEEALFPVLERYVDGPTQMLRADHKELRLLYRRLERALERLKRRPPARNAAPAFAASAGTLIQLFVNHIHKENHILFPLVRKFLTKDALREVARRMN
jgi:hemerythrin-like domain-containing protein